MANQKLLFVLLLFVPIACDRPMQKATVPPEPVESFSMLNMPNSRNPSAKEVEIVGRIVGMVPQEHRVRLKEMLLNPSGVVQIKNNAAAEALLADLAKERASQAAALPNPGIAPATLALVDAFPGGRSGVAMVVRRAGVGDFILLPENGASAEAFAAGIALLSRARGKSGVLPTKNESFLVERAGGFPRGWGSDMVADAKKQLRDLSLEKKEKVGGFARGKSTQILLRAR